MNRRKPQEIEAIINLKEDIIARSEKYSVTGYEYYHKGNVDMSNPALDNILNRTTQKPNMEVLKQMDAYLKETYENSISNVAEAKVEYNSSNSTLDDVMEKLKELGNMIEKSTLKQDIIFEIIKNAKAAELSYMENETSKLVQS